jgi:hypothetical protein
VERTTQIPTGINALPVTIRERLINPEHPEDGGWHKWMLTTAMALLNFVDEEEAVSLIREHLPRDEHRPTEVEEQVHDAMRYRAYGQLGGSSRRRTPKFAIDRSSPARLLELVEGGINLEFLRSLSLNKSTTPKTCWATGGWGVVRSGSLSAPAVSESLPPLCRW